MCATNKQTTTTKFSITTYWQPFASDIMQSNSWTWRMREATTPSALLNRKVSTFRAIILLQQRVKINQPILMNKHLKSAYKTIFDGEPNILWTRWLNETGSTKANAQVKNPCSGVTNWLNHNILFLCRHFRNEWISSTGLTKIPAK